MAEKVKVSGVLAVVRIRGVIAISGENRDALRMLRLTAANHCTILPDNRDSRGMIKRATNFVTWGEIAPDTLERLVAKRGRLPGDKRIDPKQAKEIVQKITKGEKDTTIKKVFRLSPPKKGFKSIRIAFPRGDLGYRGDKINALLERMI